VAGSSGGASNKQSIVLIDIRAMALMEFAFLSICYFIASIKAKKKNIYIKTNRNHVPHELSKLPTKAFCLDFCLSSCF